MQRLDLNVKLYKQDGAYYLDFKLPGKDRPWSVAHAINDWPQFLHRQEYNWRTFHLIHIYVEDDKMLGSFEVEVALLGLGFRIRFGIRETATLEELRARMAECYTSRSEEIPEELLPENLN